MRKHNFKPAVVDEIGKKAMHFCSNPDCLRFTTYSNTDGAPRRVAEAAHILPAGTKGPRAKMIPRFSNIALDSAENGIWLCLTCHDLIDADEDAYPPKRLLKWKKDQEILIRKIVGKDLEKAILELQSATRYHQLTREFLSRLEGRRVLYEGLDHEFPPRVLDSLNLIRIHIIDVRAKVTRESRLEKATNLIQKFIDDFLRKMGEIDLTTLRCDGGDPAWMKFSSELQALRRRMMIVLRVLGTHAGYDFKFLN